MILGCKKNKKTLDSNIKRYYNDTIVTFNVTKLN